MKQYRRGDVGTRALDGVDLDVRPGTFVAVVGPSGSGKRTLPTLVALAAGVLIATTAAAAAVRRVLRLDVLDAIAYE